MPGKSSHSRWFLHHVVIAIAIVMVVGAGVTFAASGPQQTPKKEQKPAEQTPPPDDEDLLSEEDEDLLGGEDSLLGGDESLVSEESLFGTEAAETESEPEEETESSPDRHEALFLENRFPSADTCATCHPSQYREWSVSQHAYSQLSPLMMAMQNFINVSTSTTNGDFCLRCHAPIGSELGEPFAMSNLDRHPASREGTTCISCHRVSRAYGKVAGRTAIDEGSIVEPVKGPTGSAELKRVLDNPQEYRVVTAMDQPGRKIHGDIQPFFELTTPGFCGTCHDVIAANGFRIEDAFSEYKHSPAARKGVTCQDCHMGREQGAASGYETGPAAIVGGVPTEPRKLTSHFFGGPDYPIIHPGIFPHNVEAAAFKTPREWIEFDWRAGWGTDEFEDAVPDDFEFPEAWRAIDDRYDARAIIEDQLELLGWARGKRLEVMRNGFGLSEIRVERADRDGLRFSVDIASETDGHLVPTGFDAERLIFLQVTVTDALGKVVFESGDRDPNGDVRDLHSSYVNAGLVPLDPYLFSLQAKTLTRLNRGGEQESVLPVNTSVSSIPLVRPDTRATMIYGRNKGVRKHRQGIPPGSARTATYEVAASQLTGNGPYAIEVELRFQAVPINLVKTISGVGFDYNMSPREVADAVIEGGGVLHRRTETAGLDASGPEMSVSASREETEGAGRQ